MKKLPLDLSTMPPGRLADALYDMRAERLKIEGTADIIKAEELRVKEHLLRTLAKDELKRLSGTRGAVSLTTNDVPRVLDWEKLRAYVKRTGAFDLLQKRTSAEAFRERWSDGKEIPGVEKFTAIDLSVRKAAG